MQTGWKELSAAWQRCGRKWLAGFVLGVWFGALVGVAIAVKFDLASRWSIYHVLTLFGLQVVVLVFARLILVDRPQPGSSSSAQ